MKTVNSISGGKTSAYIAANYPADYDVFSLVRISDPIAKFPDDAIRKQIEDRIQAPFIGTAEDDTIIYTILDLEQFIGREITWVTGETFDQITSKSANVYLPNKVQRFCTVKMKIEPMFYWWAENVGEPIETRIGFRANEKRRAVNMLDRCNENGLSEFKATFGKHPDGRNKWENVAYQKPSFPLIDANIYKDAIEEFWKDKPVRFAWMNNCVGCFHKNPLLLKKMWEKHPNKLEWFAKRERESTNNATWRSDVTYDSIKSWNPQFELFDTDFNECDSGYCGL
jgi:hypothetical protein